MTMHARRRVRLDLREDVARALARHLEHEYLPVEARPALVALEAALRHCAEPRPAQEQEQTQETTGANA